MRARLAQAQVALMLLTRLPAGRLPAGAPVPTLAQAVWAYPIAGAVVGALGAGAFGAASILGLPAAIAGTIALAAMILATGGLHEDGLADVADGFGGGQERARKLDIMRDSRIGSYGTLALILALLLRVQAIASVAQFGILSVMAALVVIEVASRAGLGVLLRAMPPARAQGLGQLAGSPPRAAVGVSLALGAGALAIGFGAGQGGAVLGAIVLAQALVALLAMRQIGGQTGDVMGAAQQGAALAAWLVLVAVS
jgi:adenosylcobinamide-GDP ribazoletransferase